MSVSISTNRVVPQGAEPDERSVDSHFGRASKPCSDEKQQKRTANCPIDRGNRRRMIRGAELVIRRPRPPRLAPTDEEEAAKRVAISPTGQVNADALTKKCVDELGDDSAIPTPSTSTDSPASSKEGSLNSSMLEYLLFELSSSSSASDHGTDEVLFEGFISDDDTPR
ncbi:hypothetical protein Pmar_PMAR027618 [Perkinsus marinus ATCC 50983]|uniref:Uncharacterized protein n=1 Tax=Perkinsus marinus (strain ATCC 50983 / TXsc) TaxID=423536 RepID=C5KC89_PERM5|nr:hypothetical protein Pmar_PMAR027618 [Perkinsus marinus ATCC 50983]EER17902.1 hypothetical protein Pmar_PMAR027618 [Perkinsus marinus ATCC 50983]|eukprot:XP_002786106.1 hypothetical protein Pmar_PMAR027618 [Perkinsus marinus ATCC 50983]